MGGHRARRVLGYRSSRAPTTCTSSRSKGRSASRVLRRSTAVPPLCTRRRQLRDGLALEAAPRRAAIDACATSLSPEPNCSVAGWRPALDQHTAPSAFDNVTRCRPMSGIASKTSSTSTASDTPATVNAASGVESASGSTTKCGRAAARSLGESLSGRGHPHRASSAHRLICDRRFAAGSSCLSSLERKLRHLGV